VRAIQIIMQRTKKYTEKVLQFGEGNFLRCFIDWQLDILNEKKGLDAGVTVIRPIDGSKLPLLDSQNGLYTTIIRGLNEKNEAVEDFRLIESVNREIPVYQQFEEFLKVAANPQLRYVFSNTTEAGIVFEEDNAYADRPPASFPAKLTRFLHERFLKCREGALVIIPCELIDDNGTRLREVVLKYAALWQLGGEFETWLDSHTWCDSLVDRIVTGFPADEKEELWKKLGYEDNFMVAGEYFHLWVIRGPQWLKDELKLEGSGLNVIVTDNIKPYKQRKVGILNGGHTMMVTVAYLAGLTTVREAVEDELVGGFLMKAVSEAVIPALPLERSELEDYAAQVIRRFKNPYIKHQVLSITLNHMSKFKERVWYTTIEPYYNKFGKWPELPVFSLAAAICFYKGSVDGKEIPLNDNEYILEAFKKAWSAANGNYRSVVESVLKLERLWGKDLSSEPGLADMVAAYAEDIDTNGMRAALKKIVSK
jgi:tagaturonate reductase